MTEFDEGKYERKEDGQHDSGFNQRCAASFCALVRTIDEPHGSPLILFDVKFAVKASAAIGAICLIYRIGRRPVHAVDIRTIAGTVDRPRCIHATHGVAVWHHSLF